MKPASRARQTTNRRMGTSIQGVLILARRGQGGVVVAPAGWVGYTCLDERPPDGFTEYRLLVSKRV
jgi:hypothetical protein